MDVNPGIAEVSHRTSKRASNEAITDRILSCSNTVRESLYFSEEGIGIIGITNKSHKNTKKKRVFANDWQINISGAVYSTRY
jgi:hypothetical protein